MTQNNSIFDSMLTYFLGNLNRTECSPKRLGISLKKLMMEEIWSQSHTWMTLTSCSPWVWWPRRRGTGAGRDPSTSFCLSPWEIFSQRGNVSIQVWFLSASSPQTGRAPLGVWNGCGTLYWVLHFPWLSDIKGHSFLLSIIMHTQNEMLCLSVVKVIVSLGIKVPCAHYKC